MSGSQAAEIDAAYAACDERPLDEPDEWRPGLVPRGGRRIVIALPTRDAVPIAVVCGP